MAINELDDTQEHARLSPMMWELLASATSWGVTISAAIIIVAGASALDGDLDTAEILAKVGMFGVALTVPCKIVLCGLPEPVYETENVTAQMMMEV